MPVTINGDGLIEVGGTSTTQGRVRLAEDTDNGSNYVELTAPASVTANRTVTFPDVDGTVLTTGAVVTVAQGGTGATSLTANNVLLGNGTSAVQVVAPGASGNLLTSNGTTWTSAAPASSFVGFRGQAFTSNGTFTIPTGITAVKVTVVGGGGSGGAGHFNCFCGSAIVYGGGGGGGGGTAISFFTGLTPGNTISVTVGGAGGNSSVSSGTQSITTATGNAGSAGSAANSNFAGNSGAGGSASGGTINITGGGGGSGDKDRTGGLGGNSFLGGTSREVYTQANGQAGVAGSLYGGGGGGGAGTGGGASGAQGIVIFEW